MDVRRIESGRIWIVADLHLIAGEPDPRFAELLAEARREKLETLLVLGDLFHYWFGRRHVELGHYRSELDALRALTTSGTNLVVVPGNRDFLLGGAFERATGGTVVHGAIEHETGELSCHLSHGDDFATSDLSYQAFRKILHSAPVRGLAHVLPASVVERCARAVRGSTSRSVVKKPQSIFEPDRLAVAELIESGYDLVLCGHFHRRIRETLPTVRGDGEFFVLTPFDQDGTVVELRDGTVREFEVGPGVSGR